MLSLGQTTLLALPHHSCSDFPHRLHSVCPNPFGEATGFCLPCLVYWFPLASACFLLVSLCCSWPLTWVTLGGSPSGCPCPSVGLSEVSLSMAGSASPAASSTASTAPCLQEHHFSLKAATCFLKYVWARAPCAPQMGRSFGQVRGCSHMFQRWLGLALDSSWLPSTLVIPCYQTPAMYAQCTGSLCRLCCPLCRDLHAAHWISFRISILTGKASESWRLPLLYRRKRCIIHSTWLCMLFISSGALLQLSILLSNFQFVLSTMVEVDNRNSTVHRESSWYIHI